MCGVCTFKLANACFLGLEVLRLREKIIGGRLFPADDFFLTLTKHCTCILILLIGFLCTTVIEHVLLHMYKLNWQVSNIALFLILFCKYTLTTNLAKKKTNEHRPKRVDFVQIYSRLLYQFGQIRFYHLLINLCTIYNKTWLNKY